MKKMVFLVVTSFRNLWRSPLRTGVSLASIAAATASILLFQSFSDGVRTTFRRHVITSVYAHFEISEKGLENDTKDDPYGYQIEDIETIRARVETTGPIEFFGPRQIFFGLVNFNNRSYGGVGFGVDAKAEKGYLTLMQVERGKHLADCEESSIFLSTGLAKLLRADLGSLVTVLANTSSGSINALDLEVCGIFRTGVTDLDRNTYLVNLGSAQRLLAIKGAQRLLIGYPIDDELKYRNKLEKLIADEFPGYVAKHWRDRASFYDNSMAWLDKQIFVFRAIVLLIAMLSIINVFTMGLMERLGEFGTLRAIGTYRSEIARMIFTEGLIQAFLGGVIGLVVGLLMVYVVLTNGITMPPPPLMSVPFHVHFSVTPYSVLWVFSLCTFVSAIAGIYPAIKISRVNIVKALGRNV